jgi:hypothetical protein
LIDKSGMGGCMGCILFSCFFQLGVWGGQLHWSKEQTQ